MEKLIVASNNSGKIAEIKELLSGLYDVRSLADERIDSQPEETGNTFEENALIKARAVCTLTGSACLADDSGLIVDALGGAPGVYSARYAGEEADAEKNNRLLLANMAGKSDRTARFECAVVLYKSDGDVLTGVGTVEGRILDAPCGSGGFGYDPLFFCDDLQKSFGEASREEKNSVSHRARALKQLMEKVKI